MMKQRGKAIAGWKSFIQVIEDNTMQIRKLISGMTMAGLLAPGFSSAESGYYGQGQDEAGYAASTLDSRVARLEKRMSGQPLAEMSRDIDRLREDIRLLRGAVEELRNGLDKVRKQDKDRYAELEKRNAELESRLLMLAPGSFATPGTTLPPAPGTDPNAPAPLPGVGLPGVALPAPVGSPADPATAAGLNPDGSVAAAPLPATAAPVVPAPPPPDPAARQRDYERAFETLKAGKYTDAIAEFQTFVAKYPAGDFSDNAQYWLGEAHYVNRDYAAARESFRTLVKDFPQSGKVADAQLKLAFIEYENQQFAKARSLLNEVVKQYPETSVAKMAEKRLERMKQENH